MIIETFEAGPVATNGYLVADEQGGKALVIDAPQGVAPLMVEQALDKLTLLAQELYLMIGLCLQFEQNDTDATTLIKSLRENNQLGFDSLGRISYGPFGGGTSMLSITGFTGGGPTNIDGINTTLYPIPSFFIFVIGGASSMWVLQTSSATPGRGVIQPTDNSALRFIQVG